ncbi:MAG: CDC27 family protein [Planctomycetales bacterium]
MSSQRVGVHSFENGVWRVVLAAWLGGLPALLVGCGNDPSSSTGTTGQSSGGSGVVVGGADDQCAEIVANIHDTFQLQRLGQVTTVVDGVARMNDWRRSCAAALPSLGELPESVAGAMSSARKENLHAANYTLRDGEHVRDAMLLRSVARYAFGPAQAGQDELARVVRAFEFVIRTIELAPPRSRDLPLTQYEVLLLGKGSAADRAWVFASLLRQERMDAFLIAPGSQDQSAAESAAPFLVGVLLDERVHLFDPQLGLPIPAAVAPAENSGGPGVATLEEVVGDPALLRQLDAGPDAQYPLTAALLERPAVWLITCDPYSADRLKLLQAEFTGAQSMVISDPLQDAADVPGLWSRVRSAGRDRWSDEAMRVWGYPEEQMSRHAALGADDQQALAALFLPFQAFLTVADHPRLGHRVLVEQEEIKDPAAGIYDPEIRKNLRTTTGSQMRSRLTQLDGDFAAAVPSYHEVWRNSREVVQLGPPPAVLFLHQRAIDDASFWQALCKFDQGEYRVAIDHCLRYQRQHEQQPEQFGVWIRQCRYLLALSYAALKNYKDAIAELSPVESDDPEYAAYQWRIRQWSR